MPRKARLDTPGALHHIMVRGINRSDIFEDDRDRSRFLARLGQNVIETQSPLYAWVLMDTHVHLLVRSGQQGISALMRKLLTWYAQYFNRRHRRTGHLFENRYKSILCEEENYLLALVRYIHLNPIRAKMVRTMGELDRYPWSGHRMIIGKKEYPWMDRAHILGQFAGTKRKGIRAYHGFVQDGLGEGRRVELTGGELIRSQGGWSQVLALGSGEFVDQVLREAEERQLRQMRFRRRSRNIEDLIKEECGRRKVSEQELRKGSRRLLVSEVRAATAHRSKEELGISGAEIARHSGVNTSSINRTLARTAPLATKQIMHRKHQRPQTSRNTFKDQGVI
jgi:putative transposase